MPTKERGHWWLVALPHAGVRFTRHFGTQVSRREIETLHPGLGVIGPTTPPKPKRVLAYQWTDGSGRHRHQRGGVTRMPPPIETTDCSDIVASFDRIRED
jgi:hypothetical protein